MKISIIIPAHNEEERIGRTLFAYSKFFKNLKEQENIDFEILVVINNTQDKTEDIVKVHSKENSEIRCIRFKEGGKGFAIIEGFRDSLKRNNDLIGFIDADMATAPEHFYWLIKYLGKHDGAIASRGHKKSIVKTSLKRKITHKGFNFVVRSLLFLPYSDTQCGAKIFKREAIDKVVNELGITQWGFDVDLLYRLNKKRLKIKEIPTVWEDQQGSKINLKSVPIKMFASVVRLRLINSPFKGFIRIYNKMPESIKIHHLI
ncbi:MAG: glycosyltransferase [Candidatus Pacearchaeota archaeon]|jgi:glycosyltransferase involved in cell wall biosynthesis